MTPYIETIMDWEDIPVREVMSSPVREASGETPATEAAELLCEQRIGSLLVRGTPDGILTDTDIVRAVKEGKDPATTVVAELRSSPLVTIDADAELQRAAELMDDHGLKRLVVTEDGNHVGMVSTTDLIDCLAPELEEIISVFATD
jgi:CBS domain-containing protein